MTIRSHSEPLFLEQHGTTFRIQLWKKKGFVTGVCTAKQSRAEQSSAVTFVPSFGSFRFNILRLAAATSATKIPHVLQKIQLFKRGASWGCSAAVSRQFCSLDSFSHRNWDRSLLDGSKINFLNYYRSNMLSCKQKADMIPCAHQLLL